MRECLGAEPDPWQHDVLMAFPHHQRIAMKACKGPGKTALLAVLAWNFLATRPHPKIAATSITSDNLADGLWSEMAKWQSRSPFLTEEFKWNKERIVHKEFFKTWFMSARSWSKSASQDQQANTLAGLHADYIMFILDESGGIPDAVMVAADAALASGIEQHIVQAGNPTHLEGPLYRASKSDQWWTMSITADPLDPKRTPRVSVKWAQEQIDEWGRDNPWVMVNVLGLFPPTSMNTLLGPDDIDAAMARNYQASVYENSQKRLGIDVARFGDDSTIIFPRQGIAAFRPVEMLHANTQEIAGRIMMARAKWGSEMEFIDSTGGYSAGVEDNVISAGHSLMPINFGQKAQDARYFNARAEMYFRMAEWVKRGGALPKDMKLKKELCAPTYWFTPNGKFQLESKDQIKARLGFSPDKADALGLTFAFAELPRSVGEYGQKKNHRSDWRPSGEDMGGGAHLTDWKPS